MQVHTFISESANEAVDQIRSELGPTAVVLSVRKLPGAGLSRLWSGGQIEVVAGLPEEEQAPPPAAVDPIELLRREIRELKEKVQSPEPPIAPVYTPSRGSRNEWAAGKFLVQTGLLPLYAEQIQDELIQSQGTVPADLPSQFDFARRALRGHWRLPAHRAASPVHVFVGPPGSGKSTVLCKWLAQSTLIRSSAAAVYQLDAHTANLSSLPAVYSEILGARFERAIPGELDLGEESVFVDLPGVPLGSPKALAELRAALAPFPGASVHLVLNSAYESSLLLDQARFFAGLGVTDLILTHLDEETRWGKVWNLVFGTNLPISHLSSGQNIPGDFIEASPERLLTRQFRRQ